MKETKQYKKGIYHHLIDDPLFSTVYWIVICDKLSDFSVEYKKQTGIEYNLHPGALAQTSELDSEKQYTVLLLFTKDATPGIIAHECVHATNITFKYHGMKLDPDNDEFQAYYISFLVNKCSDALKEYGRRSKELKKKTKPRKKTYEEAPKTSKRAAHKRSTH